MITCEIFHRHVDAVIDGEVDPTTQIELDEHLAVCAGCREHMELSAAFKRQVGEALAASSAPSGLRDRIRAALDAEDGATASPAAPVGPPFGLAGIRLPVIRPRYAVPAAAAAVALAVIAAREGGNPIGESETAALTSTASASSIFEDVVSRHSVEHPAEVRGSEGHQVAGWFQGKLQFPVHPIEFDRPGVHLVGGRLSRVRDRDAATFYYDVQGRRVTVVAFEPPASVASTAERASVAGRGVYYGRAAGRTVPFVEHNGVTYAIAGDLDRRTLLQLAASAHVRDR